MENSEGIVVQTAEDTIVVNVDESIYALETLLRTCYIFTDRAYIYLRREKPGHISVHITCKERGNDPQVLAGEFANELLDYRVRSSVSAESGKIRELIVAQAFAESDLLLESALESQAADSDPIGISEYHDHKE